MDHVIQNEQHLKLQVSNLDVGPSLGMDDHNRMAKGDQDSKQRVVVAAGG